MTKGCEPRGGEVLAGDVEAGVVWWYSKAFQERLVAAANASDQVAESWKDEDVPGDGRWAISQLIRHLVTLPLATKPAVCPFATLELGCNTSCTLACARAHK